MPSRSLTRWNTVAVAALDEIEDAHRAIGGSERGRRRATLQVNHAYTILLSSQFQGFCRDLHSEAAEVIIGTVSPASLRDVLQAGLVGRRFLDHGNPNPGNLGSDFKRLGFDFWKAVNALHGRNPDRQKALVALNQWRNAIAHQDWSPCGPKLHLREVRAWRSACQGLASSFDRAVCDQLVALTGAAPW